MSWSALPAAKTITQPLPLRPWVAALLMDRFIAVLRVKKLLVTPQLQLITSAPWSRG